MFEEVCSQNWFQAFYPQEEVCSQSWFQALFPYCPQVPVLSLKPGEMTTDLPLLTLPSANPALYTFFFTLTALLAISVFLVGTLFLTCTRVVDTPFKILLTNLFSSELLKWLGLAMVLFGYPALTHEETIPPLQTPEERNLTCKCTLTIVEAMAMHTFACVGVYSAFVYSFLKSELKSLKVRMFWVFFSTFLTWIPLLLTAGLLNLSSLGMLTESGLCMVSRDVPYFWTSQAVVALQVLAWLCITIFFSSTSRRLARESLREVALVRILRCLTLAAILTALLNITPCFSLFTTDTRGPDKMLLPLVMVTWVLPFMANLPFLIASVFIVIILNSSVRLGVGRRYFTPYQPAKLKMAFSA